MKNSAEFQQWLAAQPRFTTIPLNQKLEVYHVDENGNRITPPKILKTYSSDPGCSDPITNGDEVEPEVSIVSWAATNPNCTSNNSYQVYAVFTISTLNSIVLTNPNNGSQHTTGRMIVKVTSSGTTVFSNNAVTMSSGDITYNGVDPLDPNRSTYTLTWLLTSVTSTVFNGANTINLGLFFYTECPEESRYAYAVVANVGNLGGLAVCNVTSPVFVNPGVHSISGVASCAMCCTPDIIPDSQDVKFSNGYLKRIGVAQTFVISNGDVPSGHSYSIQYRNVDTSKCTGPWLTPVANFSW